MNKIEEVIALRNISVFVSSTFEDLAEERNVLSRVVFPAIKSYARRRDVSFQAIDLRWGITESESRAHGVLKACMNEIDRAYPFFIGIVGERYGWQPTREDLGDDDNELLGRASWLQHAIQKGTSITEIEFLYGALARETDCQNAWFYVKDAPVGDEHLKLLIDKLDSQKQFPVKRFKSANELGNMIIHDVQGRMDVLFAQSNEDPFTKELRRNEYVLSNNMTKIVDFPEHVYHRLDEWFSDSESPCAAIFSQGKTVKGAFSRIMCGKSMLLCQYVSILRERGYTVAYFDSGTCNGNVLESCRAYLRGYLEAHRPSQKLFMAIDNITSIAIGDPGNLASFINEYTEKCRFIISTNYGALVMRLSAQTIECPLLSYEAIDRLIDKYMGLYGKKLDNDAKSLLPHHGERLDELKRILDHLVRFGSYERLKEEISLFKNVGWETNINLIWALREELNSVENGYCDCISILNTIFVTGEAGLSEEEILSITKISSMRWAIVRERVLELCKRNGLYYTIDGSCRNETETALRDSYFTNYRDWDIIRIITWLTEHPIPFPRMAIMLDSLYCYFLGVIDDKEQIEVMERGRISLYRDVDLVNAMNLSVLLNAWNRRSIAHEMMNEGLPQWTGFKTEKHHTAQEMYDYYAKMAKVASNLGRIEEYAFFCEKQNALGNNACDGMVQRIDILIKRHNIQVAKVLYNQFTSSDHSFMVRAGLLIASDLLRRGFLDEFFCEMDALKAHASYILKENPIMAHEVQLLDVESDLLVCYLYKDIVKGNTQIKEHIIPRLQELLDVFYMRGWSDMRLWKVSQLIGYSNMMIGQYDFAMHNWLDPCIKFATNIKGKNSSGYAKAMFVYGLGFTCVNVPESYASDHIRHSKLTSCPNDELIDIWTLNAMCIAMNRNIGIIDKNKIKIKLKEIIQHIHEAPKENRYNAKLFDTLVAIYGLA